MKKSLLALAAMTAFAGAAQAQSSVTVYGLMDVGFLSTNGQSGAINAAVSAAGAAGVANGRKVTTNSFNTGNLSTSRLGFRGTEDMGGGLAASFVAEIGLTPTGNGFSGSSNMNSSPMGKGYVHNAAGVDNRQSYAGLAKKGLGDVRIGRQYTPVHEAVCATNVGECNAVAGDMIYFGANSSNTMSTAAALTDAYQVRASNAIRFATEDMNGFQAAALFSVNSSQNDNAMNNGAAFANQAGQGSQNYRMHGLNASFTGVKNLDIRAAYQLTSLNRDNLPAAVTDGAVVIGSSMFEAKNSTTQTATRITQKDAYANISYDFGIAKVALQRIELLVNTLDVQSNKRTATQVSVNAPVTPNIKAFASYGMGKKQAAPTAAEYNFSGFQLGSIYSLSKRTGLYAIYGNVTQDAVTSGQTKFNDQQYAVGMRHTF